MNTDPQQTRHYLTETTGQRGESPPASAGAPKTFEPADTGRLPPMFRTEADDRDR